VQRDPGGTIWVGSDGGVSGGVPLISGPRI
jgi:hypothetical protein